MGFWGITKTDKMVVWGCIAYSAMVIVGYIIWCLIGFPGLELFY